jgi:hypothetical protein
VSTAPLPDGHYLVPVRDEPRMGIEADCEVRGDRMALATTAKLPLHGADGIACDGSWSYSYRRMRQTERDWRARRAGGANC